MFGDQKFFGGSIFETPPSPSPNYGGQYRYGSNYSGFQNSGGGFSGYQWNNCCPQFYDCGFRVW